MAQGPLLPFEVTNTIISRPELLLGSKGFQTLMDHHLDLWVYHSGFNPPYPCPRKNLVLPVVAEPGRKERSSVGQEHLPKELLLCGTAQPRLGNTEQTPAVPT